MSDKHTSGSQNQQARYAELSRQTRRIYGLGANSILLFGLHDALHSRAGLVVYDRFGTALSPDAAAPSPVDLLTTFELMLDQGLWLLSDPEDDTRCVAPPRPMTPSDLPWAS